MPAEGARRRAAPSPGEDEGDHAHGHPDDVGEHVARVGEQGEGADQETDESLEDEERSEDAQREGHAPDDGARGTGALTVTVADAV